MGFDGLRRDALRSFMLLKRALDAGVRVASLAGEVVARVVELVLVERELGFGEVQRLAFRVALLQLRDAILKAGDACFELGDARGELLQRRAEGRRRRCRFA